MERKTKTIKGALKIMSDEKTTQLFSKKETAEEEGKRKLTAIGEKIAQTDRLLVHLMGRRLNLAMQVARAKHPTGAPTVRLEVEEKRLREVMEWAKVEGMNPNFACALLYLVINESCKVQGEYREKTPPGYKTDYSHAKLRENLLLLTQKWAPVYDSSYAAENSFKKLHLDFEHRTLLKIIGQLPDHERSLIVDIGCATGRETFEHVRTFRRVIGYDVSPHMIEQAKANAVGYGGKKRNVQFVQHDVEKGIPLDDSSVSCLYMNHGTASDIPNIRQVLLEVRRVLKPGGVFLLSFYNANALMYKTFLPWPPILGAEVNKDEHYIEVAVHGEILPVYAQAYTPVEVENFLPQHLVLGQSCTHPTIGSIFPKDVFTNKNDFELIESIDQNMIADDLGAYIVLTGKKV